MAKSSCADRTILAAKILPEHSCLGATLAVVRGCAVTCVGVLSMLNVQKKPDVLSHTLSRGEGGGRGHRKGPKRDMNIFYSGRKQGQKRKGLRASRPPCISTFEPGPGRVVRVVGALECEQPFLAPVYTFMAPPAWFGASFRRLCVISSPHRTGQRHPHKNRWLAACLVRERHPRRLKSPLVQPRDHC